MESINSYQHVRRRPQMYGLRGNYFCGIFEETIRDLLQDYSFSSLKITADTEQNRIIFEASERRVFTAKEHVSQSSLWIAGISVSAKFIAEYQDASLRKTIIKDAIPLEESFPFCGNNDLKQLVCDFSLPKKNPVDDTFASGTVRLFSKVFPHCRIVYNGLEYFGDGSVNKISSLLPRGHGDDLERIYEFNACHGELSWEVSFCFDSEAPQIISFINGWQTKYGGTHVDCVVKAIEQAFRKSSQADTFSSNHLNLAVSIHLPSDADIVFDRCRCCHGANVGLASEPPEFASIEKELELQITELLSAPKTKN